MIEIGEANVIAQQMSVELGGKTIDEISFGNSVHKFTFFSAEETSYRNWLVGKEILASESIGSFIILKLQDCQLTFSEGLNFYWLENSESWPNKYQFGLHFSTGERLAVSVSMYGAMLLQHASLSGNKYFQVALEKPNPLSEEFTWDYFKQLVATTKPAISLKGFLGTEQRIPGLGNGTLHDIFFTAGLLPQKKLNTLAVEELVRLYQALQTVVTQISRQGGRDTEKDFYGQKGGYQTLLSQKTWRAPCPKCGAEIQKKTFLGGTIYYCLDCQN